MESFSLGACVSPLKRGTGAFTFYLRFSSVMVPALLLRRALIESEFTPSYVLFDLLRGVRTWIEIEAFKGSNMVMSVEVCSKS